MTRPAEYHRHIRYRTAPRPSPGIPIGVRSCGHYEVQSGWCERSGRKPFSEVFCGQDGSGRFGLEGRSLELHPGDCFVYRAGHAHDLLALSPRWSYRWWTLDGPLAEALLDQFGLGAGLHRGGVDPERFAALDAALADPGPLGERRASSIAYACCAELAPGRPDGEAGDALVHRALELLHRRWREPGFGVSQLADQLGVHRSLLSRRFAAAMGLSPLAYLTRLRLQRASAALRAGEEPIAGIAHHCGFADPDYFARVFRRHSGQTPTDFRRHGPR